MTKQFWTFLAIGLVVVGAIVGISLYGNKGSHLELVGGILKVRTFQMNPNATLVMLDFRAENPSDVPFVVETIEIELTPAAGDPVVGMSISKPDIENVFKYEKFLGSKYNEVLSIRDKIAPHEKADRMVGARFDLPESAIDARKSIKIRIHDVAGPVAELSETKSK
ncbi:MAG: hypothetical protein LAO79_23075 [Acidobacteriia bacterium]|nr:hypothetical protein [Terriglobia bacterium]